MSAPAAAVTQRGRSGDPRPSPPRSPSVLGRWTSAQTRNLERHALALRPFTREEFGTVGQARSFQVGVKYSF